MTKTKIYIRNLGANWIGYIIRLIVLFFLSPFIIHSLGNTAYGVWCLLVSLTGYMGLLDVGLMSSISRYINFYMAKNEQDYLNRVVSTSLFTYFCLGIILFIVATIIRQFLSGITHIPGDLIPQARWVVYMFWLNILLGFVSALFRQLLAANDRFDLFNETGVVVLVIGTIGTILVLKNGYGLIGLAVVQVISSFIGCAILYHLAKWYGPTFRIGRAFVKGETFLELCQFGVFAFISDVGAQLVLYSDSIVIGLFISVTAITFYSIGLMIAEYGRTIIIQVRNVVIPDILKCASGDNLKEMRWLLVRTTCFLMFIAVPIMVGFITLGKEFVLLWMGQGYEQSAAILSILAISHLGAVASFSCLQTLIGAGRIKWVAAITIAEGITNLGLSIFFVTVCKLGIVGVALGTLIPMMGFTAVVVPIFTCRAIEFKLFEFVRATHLRWLRAAIIFALPCFAAAQLPILPSWPLFFAKAIFLTIFYLPIGFYLLLTKNEQSIVIRFLRRSVGLVPVIKE